MIECPSRGIFSNPSGRNKCLNWAYSRGKASSSTGTLSSIRHILPRYRASGSYMTVSSYSNKSFTPSSSTWSLYVTCPKLHLVDFSKCDMWCSWYHHPKRKIRSKRPVGAHSADMGDLCPFPISKVIGPVYLWPPEELESPSNPTIFIDFFQTLYGMSSRPTSFSLNRKQLAPESSKTWICVRLPSTSNWAGPSGHEPWFGELGIYL